MNMNYEHVLAMRDMADEVRKSRSLISCQGGGATVNNSPVTLTQKVDNSVNVNLTLNIKITGDVSDVQKKSITETIKSAVSNAINSATTRHKESFSSEIISEEQL